MKPNSIVIAYFLWFVSVYSIGQGVFTSKASANWSTGTTTAFNLTSGTDSDGIPDSDDDVVVASGHTITVNGNYNCKSLTINSTSSNNGITISSTNTLTINSGSGTVTMNSPTTSNVNSTLSVGTGSLVCGNISMIGSITSSRNTVLSISTGTVTCTGITFSGTAAQAQVSFSGAGQLKIGGGMLGAGGTFNCGTGTVEYTTLTGGQTINPYTYYNLTLSNSSGTNTAAGNITITTSGTLTTTSGGTLNMSTYALIFSGSNTILNNGIVSTLNTSATPFTTGQNWNGTVIYASLNGGQTIMAGTYSNLSFSNTSGTNTLSGSSITVNNTFATTSGTIQTASTSLILNNSVTGSTSITSSGSSNVTYGKSGDQNILQGTYNHLTISGGGTKTQLGNVVVGTNGVLTLNSGIVQPNGNTLTVTNLLSSGITGGSSNSYVIGALTRAMNTTTGSFEFPIGTSSSYYPLSIINPTRSSTGQTVTVAVLGSNPNGNNGSCVSAVSSTEYWSIKANGASLSGASISLGRSNALGSLNGIGQSTSVNGSYASLGGTITGTNINTSNTLTTITAGNTNYFTIVQVSSTLPSISSPTSTSVTSLTASLGGNITSVGCQNVTERGVYISSINGFSDGSGTKVSSVSSSFSSGAFTITFDQLVPNTTYYYKAFTSSINGTVYTSQGTFTTLSQIFPLQDGFNSTSQFPTSSGATTSGGWEINTGSGGSCNLSRAQLAVSQSNKWFYTQRFYATSGKVYKLSFESKYSTNANVKIYVLNGQDSTSVVTGDLFNTVSDGGSSFVSNSSDEWICSSSGVYSFAIKASTGSTYTCQIDCISISETTPSTITWDGSTSTSWTTTSNWDLNRTPISTDIIIVPAGLTNYPSTVPDGAYNTLTLNRGSVGSTTFSAVTFLGNVTISSSFSNNSIIFNAGTSIGGNLSVGESGSNFNFINQSTTTVGGNLTLGNVNVALSTTLNGPISATGIFTMGNNANHQTTISYTHATTKAITASNSGSFIFYGSVIYSATSGNQIVMKSQYNGAVSAIGAAKRYMEGNLDINNHLTLSAGDWYCGSPTSISISGTLGSEPNVKLSNSPYKGSGISGRWQGIFTAGDFSSIGVNDLITSISFYIDEKFSDRAFNNFTIKAALLTTDRFTQEQPSGYWPFFNVPLTTVFLPKNVTTLNQNWNTHIFDTPLVWDGVSNILIEITFNNLASSGGSGLAPDGTSDDKVAYIGGAWGNNIIVQTKTANTDITASPYGSNSNYKNVTMFNAANGPFDINITNNWLNSGCNFYHLKNTVTFDGFNNQQVTTRGDNYYNFVVNNTYNNGSSLTLLDDCEVENNASLQDGVINTGAYKLVLLHTDPSKLTNYSNISYVKGNLRRYFTSNNLTYAFPLGKGYTPTNYFLTDIINKSLIGVSYIDGKFIDGFPTGYSQQAFSDLGKQLSGTSVTTRNLKKLDQAGYTQLDPNQQPTGGSYDIKMYSENYTLSEWLDNHQCIMKRPTGSLALNDFNMAGSIYPDDGLGRVVSQNYLLSTNLTSFSEFAAGLGNPVALPIELIHFEVKKNKNHVELLWSTATELNNNYFEIQRSHGGTNFKSIGQVRGNGTRSFTSHYGFTDSFPLLGISYYRLKQVDYDAKFEYLPIRAIQLDETKFYDFKIYPNPIIDNTLCFTFKSETEDSIQIQVSDYLGRVLYLETRAVHSGLNYIRIPFIGLQRGCYSLQVVSKLSNTISAKFIY